MRHRTLAADTVWHLEPEQYEHGEGDGGCRRERNSTHMARALGRSSSAPAGHPRVTGPVPKSKHVGETGGILGVSPPGEMKTKSDRQEHRPHRAQSSGEEWGALPDGEYKYGEGMFIHQGSGQCGADFLGRLSLHSGRYEVDFLGRPPEYPVICRLGLPRSSIDSSEGECHNLQSGGPEAWHSRFYARSACSCFRSRDLPVVSLIPKRKSRDHSR